MHILYYKIGFLSMINNHFIYNHLVKIIYLYCTENFIEKIFIVQLIVQKKFTYFLYDH